MIRDVRPIMRPRVVAVLGASATRTTQGNQVIGNLQGAGFAGRIIPVHATATEINGLAVAQGIAALPPGVDTAVVAIPASGVAAALVELDAAGVRSAVVFSNGFTAEQERAFRAVSDGSRMAIHGPNCMGLIDLHEAMPLYPATRTAKARPGKVGVIAQSGSAAISLLNSSGFGISTIVTMGSEFQVTAPDYMRFFATDPRTEVIGVVLESIQSPAAFAAAARAVFAAGKSLAVLKVGRSDVGNRAVQAHTGAMISRAEAYDRFFAGLNIPTARDYDELIATLECFAGTSRLPRGHGLGPGLGIVGISGGETALACDVAADLGLKPAEFTPETRASIIAALSGAAGSNPLDLGATVNHTPEQDRAAIAAILADPGVDTLVFVQDAQASLTPTMLNNYTPHMREYTAHAGRTGKPVVMLSPSAENTHPRVHEMMEAAGIPVLRGLRAGLIALRNLATLGQARAMHAAPAPHVAHPDRATLRAAVAEHTGPLPPALVRRLLGAYGIPFVRAAEVPDATAALAAAETIGYPLVLKIASPDIAHRSDVGGVALGITDPGALVAAIARMSANVAQARPTARLTGFELQGQITGHIEAMAGFVAAPPFGALLTIGTGGTMVELLTDRSLELCPFCDTRAAEMIGATRLGALLGGYRNLVPATDVAPLARLAANLSRLAADFAGILVECDINPVLVTPGTGDVHVVDALLVG